MPPEGDGSSPERVSERLEEALLAYHDSRDRGETPRREEFLTRYPELHDEIERLFDNESLARALEAQGGGPGERRSGPPLAPLRQGDAIGSYEVLGEVARGGMGAVYRARHRKLGRTVALKVILAGVAATEVERRRFEREARLVASLDWPGICPVYEVGEHGGVLYMALKLIEGEPIDRVPLGPAPARRAAELVETAARAVAHANERGIIHRDLKPSNVLVDAAGHPWVVDFGLARLEGQQSATLTGQGELLGTLRYMAPELARGESSQADARVDVYGLGAILYRLLTGEPAFLAASSAVLLRQVLEEDPVSPSTRVPSLPRDLETICLRAMEKDPARRYPSAAALADDLRRFLGGLPIAARPPGPIERGRRWLRRHRARAAAAAIIGLTLLAIAIIVPARREAVRLASEANHMRHEIYGRAATTALERAHARELTDVYAFERDWGGAEHADLHGIEWAVIQGLAHRELSTVRVSLGFPIAAFAAEGDSVVAAGLEGAIEELDLEGLLASRLERRPGLPALRSYLFALSPRRRWLAVEQGSEIRLWDLEAGRLGPGLLGYPQAPPLWSADESQVAGVSVHAVGRVFRPAERAVIAAFRCGEVKDSFLAGTPGLELLAYAGETAAVEVLDRRDPASSVTRALGGKPGEACHAAFSRDGARLAVAWRDGRISFHETTRFDSEGEVIAHRGPVRRVAFCADGARLASGGLDRAIHVFDVRSRQRLFSLPGHRGRIVALDFHPGGRELLLSRCDEGDLKLWDTSPAAAATTHADMPSRIGLNDAPLRVLAVTSDRRFLLTGDDRKRARAWSLARPLPGEQSAPTAELALDAGSRLTTGTLSPDGTLAALAFNEAGLQLWRFAPGDAGGDPRVPPGFIPGDWLETTKEKTTYGGLAFAADGRRLASERRDQVRIFAEHAGTWRLEHAFDRGPLWAGDVALSPDRSLVAWSNHMGGEIGIFDLTRSRHLGRLAGHVGGVSGVAFSPDSRRLASTSRREAVARTWEPIRDPDAGSAPLREDLILAGHASPVLAAAWTPDGRRLVTGSADGTIRIWDVTVSPESRRGVECGILRGPQGEVTALHITSDGRSILGAAVRPDGLSELLLWEGAAARR
jgi:WD40 repeat protein/tRNA A-37 threonylcarbamoyl transferase component Bud32